ncbi:hypothetical protein A7U60_g9133 [Sanghuangporus baumii]|uniref:Ubiquitin-like protease family profile domain-containing protein n=1 Tax=Sanghuangporus baumii TaxID=108892 RepID=A0A9Q5N2D9_SANBA|nr:hypothetical protein A7U60_g9133 [Sanghuangporus baumii]
MQALGWQNEDWIGLGLKYTACAHLPLVEKQKKLLLHIPGALEQFRPSPGLSVKALLRRLDPVTQSGAIGEQSIADLFSSEESNVSLEQFFKAPILPPDDTLDALWKSFGQCWFDGKKSIVDFTYPETRYPLSIVVVYRELSRANKLRMEWNHAEEWMMRGKRSPELTGAIARVQRLMFTFDWESELRAIYTTVPLLDLFGMLGDGHQGWLNDSHIDMLMQLLSDRYEREIEGCDVLIAPCVFQQYLLEAYDYRNNAKHRKIPLLEQYAQDILTGRKQRLFFTGHVNGNHWVPWMFDNRDRPILGHVNNEGDSLYSEESLLARLRKALLWWINGHLGSETDCTYEGNVLIHGDQSGDTDSCGVISYNTIAHALFGDELWTFSNRKRLRIEAFSTIIMRHNAHHTKTTSSNNFLPNGQTSQGALHHHRVADPPSCALRCEAKDCPDQPQGQGLQAVDRQEQIESKTRQGQKAVVGQGLQIPLDSHIIAEQRLSLVIDAQGGAISDIERLEDIPEVDMCSLDSLSGLSSPTDVNASLQKMHWQDDAQLIFAKKRDDVVTAVSSTRNKRRWEATDLVTQENDNTKIHICGKERPLNVFFARRDDSAVHEFGSSKDIRVHKEVIKSTEDDQNGHELVVGVSKSAVNSKMLREACLSGTFIPNNTRFLTFKDRVLVIDPRAQFRPQEWSVQHSKCQKWLKMKSPYSPVYFREHARRCKAGSTLHDFSFTNGSLRSSSKPQKLPNRHLSYENFPCCGLTPAHDARIGSYLTRPAALGGGGRSKVALAKERYGKTYADLTKQKKRHVDKIQEDSWIWMANHSFSAVFSLECKKTVTVCSTDNSNKDHICGPCSNLLFKKQFRTAISLPEPLTSNVKFTNKRYQQEELGIRFAKCKGVNELLHPKNNDIQLVVRYAKGVAAGHFKDHVVFTGLVNCMLERIDRTARGKKLTNFKYPPAFDAFIQTVYLVCPRAHRLLADHFPIRTERSIAKIRAKQPQFVGGISPRSFDLVDNFVTALKVPQRIVGLSADDTKLLPTFRPFFDREADGWYIVGGTGESLLVTDPTTLREDLESAQQQKATKVRIWAIIVPIPKIPPVVLAAIAITDKVTADTLTRYTHQIIDGLYERHIWPVSYACDGTEKERANQRNLRAQAHGLDTRTIRAPSPLVKNININIPLYHGKPMALVQDSQHAKKTLRNNLETGTTTLVLGNDTATYGQLREMAFDEKSPIYHRDVEKGDKQDDRAAARIFSSDSLSWFIEYRPEYLGMQIYLFVHGDLCDAWQSRSITHLDRLHSILRAHYFDEFWLDFLQDADYPVKKHCISREARDITSYLAESYIELLIIYRDYTDGTLPLVPWLHSSEVCEHIFGELRKEVKDFDFAAFLNLMPKTHSMVRYRMELGNVPAHDAKARARGYAHTWLDLEGLSLFNLRAFPTDEEISKTVNEAYKDAVDLWEQLGLFPGDIRSNKHDQVSTGSDDSTDEEISCSDDEEEIDDGSQVALPSVTQWYSDMDSLRKFVEASPEELEGSSIKNTSRAVLEKLLARDEYLYENGPIRSEEVDHAMLNVSCAKLLLDLDTSLRIDELITPSADQWEEFFAEYAGEVGKCLADVIPPIVGQPYPPPSESDLRLPPSEMLELRRAHETQFTKNAVRTTTEAASPATSAARASEIEDSRARHSLIKKINDVLKLTQQDQGVGTGLERRMRWTGSTTEGNSANASVVKAVKTSESYAQRSTIYSRFRMPRTIFKYLSTGALDEGHHLCEGSFVLVFVNNCVLVGKVVAMYTKGGGKNGKHSYLRNASNIGQLSYVALQTFEYTSKRLFRAIHSSRAHLRVHSFAHIQPYEFLFALPDSPKVRHNGNSVELSETAHRLWWHTQNYTNILSDIMKEFRKRK